MTPGAPPTAHGRAPADAWRFDAPSFRERLRAGDDRAFGAVFDAWHDRIYAFVLRLLRDRATAEDVSQEVWLRAARAVGQLPDDTPLGPWLFRIARNQTMSHLRWWSLDLSRLRQLHGYGTRRVAETPDDWQALTETERALEGAFAALSVSLREVALLALVEGLDAPTIAGILSIDDAAVRQRLSRARTQLEGRLGHPGGLP